ncbi:hypothetical protein MMP66_16925 [Acinetobacter dispersus]|uniref:hypothetical protein n=1 Tax=Acinetobacter dispersus TaxID=70348 RepID=UPI001F4B3277|nr:hypothetical protein [Acinetobacter dispersus]MCH7395937.1 hypothetical protein [Acinetobacter dispersus]
MGLLVIDLDNILIFMRYLASYKLIFGEVVSLTVQEKEFLENASVKIEDFENAKIDISLLMKIAEDYLKFSADFLQEAEYIAKKLQRCNSVHSVRWRVKDVGHLIEKLLERDVRVKSQENIRIFQ